MRARLTGASRRKWITTTVRDRDARLAPDLIERNFRCSSAQSPMGRRHPYLSELGRIPVSRRGNRRIQPPVVGLGDGDPSEDRTGAQGAEYGDLAAASSGIIHHSDQSCQYTSIAFGQRYRAAGVRPAMGSVGD